MSFFFSQEMSIYLIAMFQHLCIDEENNFFVDIGYMVSGTFQLTDNGAEFLNNPSPVGLRIFFLPTSVGLRYGHRRNTHSFSRHLPSRTSVLTSLDRYRNQHPAPRLHMCPCV